MMSSRMTKNQAAMRRMRIRMMRNRMSAAAPPLTVRLIRPA